MWLSTPVAPLVFVMNCRQPDDLEQAHATGRLHSHLIPLFFVQQALSDRRRGGDQPFLVIGFFGGDEPVGDLFVAIQIAQAQRRAVRGAVARQFAHVNARKFGELLLQLADARAHVILPLAGEFILGVLRQIAQRRGGSERLRQLHGQLVFEGPQLGDNLVLTGQFLLFTHSRYSFRDSAYRPVPARRRPTSARRRALRSSG